MAVSSKLTKNGQEIRSSIGILKYSMDSYSIAGLPFTPGSPLISRAEILARAQQATVGVPVPALGSFKENLPIRQFRVRRHPLNRTRATVTVEYGSTGGVIIQDDARRTRTLDAGLSYFDLPYFIERTLLFPPSLGSFQVPFYEVGIKKHFVGQYELWQGQMQPATFDPVLTRQISIQNKLKLYQLTGANLPFIHTGVEIRDMRNGQYWTWTKYLSSGVRNAIPVDGIIEASQPVEELGILEEYRLDYTSHTTISVPPDDVYEVGVPLTWDN